jgi:hypothetical protein
MILLFSLHRYNYFTCCSPCLELCAAISKRDKTLKATLSDIGQDFTRQELEQFTKVKTGVQWAVGNSVEALWSKGQGEWHAADITEVLPGGVYTISWADGMSSDVAKTAEQLRPLYKLGSFKELWAHLDENHDGRVDKAEFMRLAPRALCDAYSPGKNRSYRTVPGTMAM